MKTWNRHRFWETWKITVCLFEHPDALILVVVAPGNKSYSWHLHCAHGTGILVSWACVNSTIFLLAVLSQHIPIRAITFVMSALDDCFIIWIFPSIFHFDVFVLPFHIYLPFISCFLSSSFWMSGVYSIQWIIEESAACMGWWNSGMPHMHSTCTVVSS